MQGKAYLQGGTPGWGQGPVVLTKQRSLKLVQSEYKKKHLTCSLDSGSLYRLHPENRIASI